MVARVTLISSRDAARSGLAPVSGLEFHAEGSNGDTSEVLPSVNRMLHDRQPEYQVREQRGSALRCGKGRGGLAG